MALNVDMGGNSLYVTDVLVNDSTPGSLSGTSVSTAIAASTAATTPVNVTGATLAPTVAQSGTTFVLSRAAGVTVTLPASTIGLNYTFVVGVVPTSNAHKVITHAGTIFLTGGLYFDKSLTITRYDGDGSTDVSVNLNGTTTGGLTIGDTFSVYCAAATIWSVEGTVTASGTLATPFATS